MRGLRNGVASVLLLGIATAAGAEDIFKCVSASGDTSYQSAPCAVGVFETRLALPSPRVEAARVAPQSTSSRSAGRRSGPWNHAVLTLGMSDDEVLNMSGWGRPSRIARQRLPREWREEWVYGAETPAERRLYFSNGKLVDFGLGRFAERVAVYELP